MQAENARAGTTDRLRPRSDAIQLYATKFAWAPGGWRSDGTLAPEMPVASDRSACYVPRATVPGTYRFEVEYVDAWGRASAPTFSTPWTLHQR